MCMSVAEVDRGVFICNFHEVTPSFVGLHYEAQDQLARLLHWSSKANLSAPELDHLRCFVTVAESQDSAYFLPRYKPQNTYAHLLVLLSVIDAHQERFKCSHTLFSRVGMSRGVRSVLVCDVILVQSSHITQTYTAWVSCAVCTHHVHRTWGVWTCCQHNSAYCSVLNSSFVSRCIL